MNFLYIRTFITNAIIVIVYHYQHYIWTQFVTYAHCLTIYINQGGVQQTMVSQYKCFL